MVRKELYNVYETSSFPVFSQILALIPIQNNSRLYQGFFLQTVLLYRTDNFFKHLQPHVIETLSLCLYLKGLPDISTSQRAIKAMYLCVCVQQMRTFSLFMRLKLTGLVLFIPFSI